MGSCSEDLVGAEFGLYIRESGFEGFAADGTGCALVEDALTLEFEGLAFELAGGEVGVDGILAGFRGFG